MHQCLFYDGTCAEALLSQKSAKFKWRSIIAPHHVYITIRCMHMTMDKLYEENLVFNQNL